MQTEKDLPIDDELEQEALFTLDRLDQDGCVWIWATQSDWCQNSGPRDKVATKFSEWLGKLENERSC